MTQQWVSLLVVGCVLGFLCGGAYARRSKDDKWNTALGIGFAIVGVLSMGNLVMLAQKQRGAIAQANAKLACIADVVEAARNTTGYNSERDKTMLVWLNDQTPTNLKALQRVLADPPPALPQCEINWQD